VPERSQGPDGGPELLPPAFDAAALAARVARPGSLWREVAVVASTGSTNTDLVARASRGAPEGLVLVAEEQTAGRGRMGRTWSAPPRSGLAVSVLLRPSRPAADLGWLPLLAGLVTAEAVRAVAGVEATVKWPNDVLVGERKLAGVLAERADEAVVVGIGLNVAARLDQLPVPTATSLRVEGADVDGTAGRAAVLVDLLDRLAARYRAWDAEDDGPGDALWSAYVAASSTLDRPVRVEQPGGGVVEGEAVDVDRAGRLVVRTATGREAVAAGDVVHVRAAR
jgi:BirA family biotin operon repressor/biotin-[acetyl-CoA-carboxylase] ligase